MVNAPATPRKERADAGSTANPGIAMHNAAAIETQWICDSGNMWCGYKLGRDKRKNKSGEVLVTITPIIGAPLVTGVQLVEDRLVELCRT